MIKKYWFQGITCILFVIIIILQIFTLLPHKIKIIIDNKEQKVSQDDFFIGLISNQQTILKMLQPK